jgi:hypothetical protein
MGGGVEMGGGAEMGGSVETGGGVKVGGGVDALSATGWGLFKESWNRWTESS